MKIKELQKAKLTLRKTHPFLSKVYGNILDAAGKKAKGENREIIEADILPVCKSMIKKLSEVVEKFPDDPVSKVYAEEIEILKSFLPPMVSDKELEEFVEELTKDLEKSMKNMGGVIGLIKSEYGETVDMGKASKLVKAALT